MLSDYMVFLSISTDLAVLLVMSSVFSERYKKYLMCF